MINIPDTRSKFPLQQIQYLDLTINELFAQILDYKRANCPNYTDENPSDPGTQFLWLWCILSDFMRQHINRTALNCFLPTVTDRVSLEALCQMLNYELGHAAAAAVSVTFTIESGHPEIAIDAGTQVATEGTEDSPTIIFETDSDQLVPIGTDSVAINCVHGYAVTEETLGSSEGEASQVFYAAKTGVLWQSETVEINDGGWEAWTRVTDFIDSIASSKHYKIAEGSDGSYYIMFGDGVNGKIPPSGSNNIRISYRVGGGEIGNVAAGTVIELVNDVQYIASITNAAAASGGTDLETIAHAQKFAPAMLRSTDRAISIQDIKTLAETYVSPIYGRIAKAAVTEVGTITAEVRIVPAAGGDPSTELKQALKEYLSDKRVVCNYLDVLDPIYNVVDIDLSIWVKDGHLVSKVVDAVRAALVTYLSPTYQDPTTGLYPHEFGRNVYTSDLVKIVASVSGVDHCSFTTPSADVDVEDYEIVDIGTLNITAYLGGVSSSWLNLSTDQ